MKTSLTKTFVMLGASASILGVLSACGVQNPQGVDEARVQFIQTSATKAVLEARDLKDPFLFGLNIIKTENFFTTALSLNFRPYQTQLRLSRDRSGKAKLFVVDGNDPSNGSLMSFDVAELSSGRLEIDFGSEQNYIELNDGLTNQLGGQVTDANPSARSVAWKTAGRPKVLKVSQDPDTIVADIEHSVSYARTNPSGGAETRTGKVTVRVFLKRNVVATQTPTSSSSMLKTVGAALKLNLGFFPADRLGTASAGAQPIVKYDIDTARKETKIVYLKDFPKDFEVTARDAIAAWNQSFGYDAFKVEIASANVDMGDPRLNVMKWFDGLEKEVPWAGYAPTMANPVTGKVLATQILINGNKTADGIRALAEYTKKASGGFTGLQGRIGNVPVVEGAGETPVVTFFTDIKEPNSDAFVKKYYTSVIMHEFGHSLGLRHNFAASTKLDAEKLPSSIMDYEPNIIANKRTAVGSYDKAAVRWAYFNEGPTAGLAFCTDEDLSKRIECNQGDVGDPVDFVVASLTNGVGLLSNSPVALPSTVEKPMLGSMKNAFKMLNLISQLPASRQVSAEADLRRSLELVRTAAPASDLDSATRAVARQNLAKVAASYKDAEKANRGSAVALGLSE